MEEFDSSAVKAVLFDVYGTLVEIADKRLPFRQLIQIGVSQGRKPDGGDASIIMSQPVGLQEAAELMGIRLGHTDRERLESELSAELASITLFPETLPVLHTLKNRGFKLGLCSNLALYYAAPILSLLPFELDAYVWSFDMGSIKPNPLIYAHACEQLGCAPSEVLMIGDTIDADVEGPHLFGMQALLLDRKQRYKMKNSLSSMFVLCDMLGR